MTGIDPEGCDLVLGARGLRLPFDVAHHERRRGARRARPPRRRRARLRKRRVTISSKTRCPCVAYRLHWAMMEIRETQEFSNWLRALRDQRGKAKILIRIDRLARGNPGDVEPVGEGVSELRVDYGPGYRVYFAKRGATLLLLLCGGDKKTQARDIARAKRLAVDYRE